MDKGGGKDSGVTAASSSHALVLLNLGEHVLCDDARQVLLGGGGSQAQGINQMLLHTANERIVLRTCVFVCAVAWVGVFVCVRMCVCACVHVCVRAFGNL